MGRLEGAGELEGWLAQPEHPGSRAVCSVANRNRPMDNSTSRGERCGQSGAPCCLINAPQWPLGDYSFLKSRL